MKQLFRITDDAPPDKAMVLLCEIGEQHLCAAEYIPEKKHIHSLSYFTFTHDVDVPTLKELLNQQFHAAYTKVAIGAAYPQAVLVPRSVFDQVPDKNVFFDAAGGRLLQDAITELGIITAYRIPGEMHRFFMRQEQAIILQHVFTTELKIYNGFVAGDQISVHFVPQQIRVLVKKEGQVQLAQMYHYATPLDVVYYLLKIREAFDLQKEETFCILSGLIDEDSSLYAEINNYFYNLHFTHPAITVALNEHPRHFFSSLYNLAACVS